LIIIVQRLTQSARKITFTSWEKVGQIIQQLNHSRRRSELTEFFLGLNQKPSRCRENKSIEISVPKSSLLQNPESVWASVRAYIRVLVSNRICELKIFTGAEADTLQLE